MMVRALSAAGDWTFGKGLNNYLFNNACVGQNIQTRLSMFLGDCFFAPTQGIDWWNLLGGKNQLALTLALNATILGTPGVTGLLQPTAVILNHATRNLSVQYSVTTVFSQYSSTYQYNFPI